MSNGKVKRSTIKDIAKEANVSIGTVYSALRNKGRIGEDTKNRILEIAKKLDYSTNKFASSLSRKSVIKVAVIFPTELKDFWNEVERGIDSAENELKDYGIQVLKYRTERYSVDEEIVYMMKLKNMGVDGIAIAPAHQIYLNETINQAVDNGIPVLTFNSDAPGSKRIVNIQNDLLRSGRLGAELVGKFISGKGNVVIFSAFPDLLACQLRVRGFEVEMSEFYKNINLFGPYTHFDNEELQYTMMVDLLNSNEDISAVFIDNANIYGAARALEECGRAGQIKLVGYDYSKRAKKLLDKDCVQALICQNPYKQGYLAVKVLFKHITSPNAAFEDIIYTNPRVILRNNSDDSIYEE